MLIPRSASFLKWCPKISLHRWDRSYSIYRLILQRRIAFRPKPPTEPRLIGCARCCRLGGFMPHPARFAFQLLHQLDRAQFRRPTHQHLDLIRTCRSLHLHHVPPLADLPDQTPNPRCHRGSGLRAIIVDVTMKSSASASRWRLVIPFAAIATRGGRLG